MGYSASHRYSAPPRTAGLAISADEGQELVRKNETFHHERTRFQFLNDHYGFRPGCMHLVIGRTGAGKSSLTRSILGDLIRSAHRVLLVSTEEQERDLKTQLAYSRSFGEKFDRLRFIHETEMGQTPSQFLATLQEAMHEAQPTVVFFDNITTCGMYTGDLRQADAFVSSLRALMQKHNVPFYVVSHSDSTVKELDRFTSQNIRGSKLIANRAEYLYLFYNVKIEQGGTFRQASLVLTEKSRNHACTNRVYRLTYDSESREYTRDEELSFEAFKEFFKKPETRK